MKNMCFQELKRGCSVFCMNMATKVITTCEVVKVGDVTMAGCRGGLWSAYIPITFLDHGRRNCLYAPAMASVGRIGLLAIGTSEEDLTRL